MSYAMLKGGNCPGGTVRGQCVRGIGYVQGKMSGSQVTCLWTCVRGLVGRTVNVLSKHHKT